MSDNDQNNDWSADDPSLEAELAPFVTLLSDPAMWEEPDEGLEDAVVAAVLDQMAADDGGRRGLATVERLDPQARSGGPEAVDAPVADRDDPPVADRDDNVIPIDRRSRWWTGPLVGMAAALLVVAGIGVGSRLLEQEDDPDHLVALAGTDLAPEASAEVEVIGRPQGTRLLLDVSELPPAGEGQYYEAWLRQSPEIGVSAGTFHLRGGDGVIELWSGVSVDDYPLITVTIQDEDAGAESSGRVVLAGRVDG